MSFIPPRRSWLRKFSDAFIGLKLGTLGQSSFAVHFIATLIVCGFAIWLKVTKIEWCLLTLCVAGVCTTEMLNSALEKTAKAVDSNFNKHLADALNIASAAVLLASSGAVIVGLLIFCPRLWLLLMK